MTAQNTHRTQNSYSPAQLEQAHALVDAHNKAVNPDDLPWCEDGRPGYLIIDLSGRRQCYFTLWRFFSQTVPSAKPYMFIRNLSTDLITAVQKVATHRGLPIALYDNDNFNPEHIPHICFQHGKYKGQSISSVYEQDPGYVIWAANKFTARNKKQRMVLEALNAIKQSHFQLLTEQNRAQSTSQYQGDLKDRLQLTLTITACRQYRNQSGPDNFRYRAQDAHGNLFQFYYKKQPLVKGAQVDIVGTVKAHREFVGKQITCLNRVKVTGTTPSPEPDHDRDPHYDRDDQPHYSHRQQTIIDRLDLARSIIESGGCPEQAAEIRAGA